MLLFIYKDARVDQNILEFKYISCCCLSGTGVVGQRNPHHSNTSHVVVYQKKPHRKDKLL